MLHELNPADVMAEVRKPGVSVTAEEVAARLKGALSPTVEAPPPSLDEIMAAEEALERLRKRGWVGMCGDRYFPAEWLKPARGRAA